MGLKLTIDGRTLDVEPGMTIMQAAHEAGIQIPYYCYHPGLVVDGNCRICLVEIEKAPKLAVACKTPVTDQMVVHTANERVKAARRAVMEFLLINHPIDCPVCDQAGECKLQDYYYDYDLADSRLKDRKVHKEKVQTFGAHVAFDGERCILCSRCVRFTRDVTETHELAIFNRGNRSVVGLTPGMSLDNPYSLNVVDICPVGALTSRDFRFRKRVWFLDETPSVCPGCSRGCAIWLDASKKDNLVYRIRPRKNMLVNQYWMCDAGRFSYKQAENDRLGAHRVGGRTAELATAVAAAADLLRSAHGVGVLVSRAASNEELFALRRIVTALPNPIVALNEDRVAADGEVSADDFLIEEDKNPNTTGARRRFGIGVDGGLAGVKSALHDGKIDTLLLCGRGAQRVLGGLVEKARGIVRISAHTEDLGRLPDVELAGRVWAEKRGSFTNSHGVISGFLPALAATPGTADDLTILADLGRALGADVAGDVDGIWSEMSTETPELAGLTFGALMERTAVAPGAVEGV